MPKIRFLLRSDKPAFHAIPRPLRVALRVALVAYVGACAGLALLQRQALFHPMAAPRPAPAGLVWTGEGEARFWVAPSGSPSCPAKAVAYFGGNAEAPSDGAQAAASAFPGCPVYALAYPGYEGAPGSASEASIHQAADAMVARMLRDGFKRQDIIFAGRSLGSGEAVRQSSLGACFAAYLATPYDSLAQAASRFYPWAPISLLMLDRFDAQPWAKNAQCPAAILAADQDRVIPADHAYNLSALWNPSQPTRLTVAAGGHDIDLAHPAGVSAFGELARAVGASRAKAR